MQVLTVDRVSFSYDARVPVLTDVSLGVRRGEFLSLVGPNGSGKTTLLRLLDRIFLPAAGGITLDGRPLTAYARAELARKVAFVPQDAGALFPFTVMEVVLMGRSSHSRGRMFESAADRTVAARMLRLADVEHLADKAVTALSGGERQRVFIARALAQEPEIILLDEPNAHLDIAHQVDIFTLLRRLNRDEGLTVVSVSHDLNLAASFSDTVVMLLCGTVAAAGAPAAVLTEGRIREVFRTNVLVDTHPAGSSPRITLLT